MPTTTALFKSLLILTHTICCHICYTPPNTAPSTAERRSYKRNAFERVHDTVGMGFIIQVRMHLYYHAWHDPLTTRQSASSTL